MNKILLIATFLTILTGSLRAQTESEPNNTLATANPIAFATNIGGGGLCSTDNEDWFRVIQPAGGKSVRLIATTSMVMTGQTGGIYIYIYNKYGQALDSKYITLTSTAKTDTLDYTCFEGDTFYVRILNWSGAGCKQYSIRCENTNNFTLKNDTEPNDGLSTAVALIFQKDTTGHLASQRYFGSGPSTDIEDWYRCVLPLVGTRSLRLITSTRSVEPGTSGSVYYYFYNKFGQQLTNQYVSFNNTAKTDTLDYNCFEGDTFYVRVYHWTGSCKEYRIKADFTNTSLFQNDTEPNDNLATAINLPFQKDTTGHLGSQRYLASASTDNEDWFRCVLPPVGTKSLRLISGTRATEPGATGSVYYYLYNKYGQNLTNNYVSFGNTLKLDTLDFNCLEGDTFYVRVYNWSGNCKEYTLKTDYTNNFSLQNDAEPNDVLASATPLPFQKDTTGHLGSQRYLGTGPSTDNEDWYQCALPPGGTKSLRLISSSRSIEPGGSGSVYYYLYNKYGQVLANQYVAFNNVAKADTLDFNCFEGDTFYVRVYNWTGNCKEYRIKMDYTNYFTLQNDAEPNESIATANAIDFKQITTGHLAAQVYGSTAPGTDNEDFYRCILPGNGKGIRIATSARMATPGTTGSLYYYIYSKTGAILATKYLPLTDVLTNDTVEYNCYQPDTFYVRFVNWYGACKEYSFQATQSTTGPIAFDISHTRFGNDFSFMNTTRNATKFAWTFGDGKTDTVAAPVHGYGIGTFYVRLNATNVCGTKTFRDTLSVSGIEYYTPKTAGTNTGFGVFNVRVFGGGLDSNLTITLKKGGTDFKASRVRSPRSAEATGTFNFKDVAPGKYDVQIKLANGQVYNYPGGFDVYVDTAGLNITTEIFAPTRVRTARLNTYSIRINNKNGRVANGVRAYIVLPRGMKNNIHKILYEPKGKIVVKGKDFEKLTIDPDFYKEVYYGGDFDPNRDTIAVDRDKIYSAIDSTTISYDVDSLFSQPYKGTVYPIYIPFIKANGHHTLSFQAGTPGNGNFNIASFVEPWTMRQNPVSGETLDFIHEGGMQAAAIAELTPIPGLKQVGAAAGYIDIGSQTLFAEGFDWWYGTNVADEEFYARQGVSLIGELAGELVPYNNRADDAVDAANSARRRLARNTESLQIEGDIVMAGLQKNNPAFAQRMAERIKYLEGAIKRDGSALTRLEKEEAIRRLQHWSAKQGISLTKKGIESLLFPEDIEKKPVESLTSYDPNEIYGPSGTGNDRYIRRADEMSYEVTFENMDTALVPAQIVRVNVALDTTKFDLRKTTLNSVRFGGKLYIFEEDRKEYFRDIDLRPAKNMIVRVNAKTDTVKGTLYWEFLSLDPLTKNLIEDVLDGFLPPNKNSPEGEGAVSFTTHLKASVANRDTVSAFATIYFDDNDPILTGVWKNKVDEGRPGSILNPTVQVTNDSVMVLGLTGNDAESGFQEYRLYVKDGDSAWTPKPYRINELTGNTVTGVPGKTYSFYIEARDSVGIWEKKPQLAEATVTLKKISIPVPAKSFAVYPNPAKNSVTVRVNAPDAALRINITSITGQLVSAIDHQHSAGTADYPLSTAAMASGVYFVDVLLNDVALATEKLVILR